MKNYGEIDSKFRYVILASKRAKQLLAGAKPKIKTKSKNPIRIAQKEVKKGLVDYEIILQSEEEEIEPEQDFIGEEIGEGIEKGELEVKKETEEESEGQKEDED